MPNLIFDEVIMPRFLTFHQNNKGLRPGRTTFVLFAATLLSCVSLSFPARAIVFDFANLPGTVIGFSGGAFSFTSSGGYQFDITSVTGGVGDSVGLKGYVSGGPFTIGTITVNGQEQTAPVGGTGTLHITDAASHDLTGSIQWDTIATFGVAGILDLTGTINLTGITYGGLNNDLQALAGAGSAADVVTFQFLPAIPLNQLESTGGTSSYSGLVEPVPEPGSLSILGVGLAGLVAKLLRRRKK